MCEKLREILYHPTKQIIEKLEIEAKEGRLNKEHRIQLERLKCSIKIYEIENEKEQ